LRLGRALKATAIDKKNSYMRVERRELFILERTGRCYSLPRNGERKGGLGV